MSRSPHLIAWLLPLGLAVCVSCSHLNLRPIGKSPLSPARMSPDAMVLDVFFVPVKYGDPEANAVLWQELDEQHFPVEVRRELNERGFRVGRFCWDAARHRIVSQTLPPSLCFRMRSQNAITVQPGCYGARHASCRSRPRHERRHSDGYDTRQRVSVRAHDRSHPRPGAVCAWAPGRPARPSSCSSSTPTRDIPRRTSRRRSHTPSRTRLTCSVSSSRS